jgi:hypothetical protein
MEKEPKGQPSGFRRVVPSARALVYVLYALLAASALVTLTGVPMLEEAVGRLPRVVLMAAPALLGLFIALFALYRYLSVRAGRYPGGRALVQVALMLIVLTLLLPQSMARWRSAGLVGPVGLQRALVASDPEQRALAAELARHRPRPEALQYVPQLIQSLGDPAPEVRRQAHDSLVSLAGGQDAGGAGPDAAERWRAYWSGPGLGVKSP